MPKALTRSIFFFLTFQIGFVYVPSYSLECTGILQTIFPFEKSSLSQMEIFLSEGTDRNVIEIDGIKFFFDYPYEAAVKHSWRWWYSQPERIDRELFVAKEASPVWIELKGGDAILRRQAQEDFRIMLGQVSLDGRIRIVLRPELTFKVRTTFGRIRLDFNWAAILPDMDMSGRFRKPFKWRTDTLIIEESGKPLATIVQESRHSLDRSGQSVTPHSLTIQSN